VRVGKQNHKEERNITAIGIKPREGPQEQESSRVRDFEKDQDNRVKAGEP
jgi:hypothetical protein